MQKLRTGVIGAGAISDIYLTNMIGRFEHLDVRAVAARHFDHAKKKAEQYGIRACTVRKLMEDPDIDMIVNLTPVGVHYELVREALLAGKHVYTEKTLADTPERASQLIALAEEKGVCLGSAPDTFLGASLQTARKAIDDGLIGTVTSFSAAVNRDADVLTSLFYFLHEEGANVALDYGVYYVTALVSLLGPVSEVAAYTRTPYPVRKNILKDHPDFGKDMSTPNESILSALMRFENGVTGTLQIDEESVFQEQVHMVIYGTEGMLYLQNPDYFGGEIRLLRNRVPDRLPLEKSAETEILPYVNPYDSNSRGIGPEEMARAIIQGKRSRLDPQMACHVLDVLDAMLRSGRSRAFEEVSSSCRRPEPFLS